MDDQLKSLDATDAVSTGKPQDCDPEFRTISHMGRRYAIRLEPVFWKVLELAASHRREKLGAHVGKILSEVSDESNRTSVLRVHAVNWLSRRLLEAATQSISQKSINAISAATVRPVFSIGRNNKLAGHNAAFYELLRTLSDEAGIELSDNLSVVFKREADELRAALSASRDKFVEEKIIIKLGTRSIERSVRVAALETASGQHTGFYVIVH